MRVGLVGGGRIAEQAHLPALSTLPDVEIVLCEPDSSRAHYIRAAFPIAATVSSMDELLMRGCDALMVMVPHAAMFDVIGRCLESGTPTLLEKPPGMTLAHTVELARIADAGRVVTMVGFNSRFRPDLRAGLERLRDHGRILSVLAYAEMPSHRRLAASGITDEVLANVLPAHAIHRVDLFRFLLGEPTAVYADTRATASQFDDVFHATVLFAEGVAQLNYTMVSSHRYSMIRIVGLDCGLASMGDGAPFHFDAADSVAEPDGAEPDARSYLEQDRYFLKCVAGGVPVGAPAADLRDSVRTMRLLDAIRCGHRGAFE